MLTVGSDIDKFNQYVSSKVEMLRARGEDSTDLLTNLFKAYNAAQDPEFVKYIRMKESEYEDGTDYTVAQLMGYALNKYKTLKQKNLWMAPTPMDEKILALTAEVRKYQAKDSNKRKKAPATPARDSKPKKVHPSRKAPPPFIDERPVTGKEREPRVYDGRNWWYCHETTGGKCPGKWRTHQPHHCRWDEIMLKAKKSQEAKETGTERSTKLTRAYQAVIEDGDDDGCLLYTSPSPRDQRGSRMPSSA